MDVSRKGLKRGRLVGSDKEEKEEKKTELPLDIVFEFLTWLPRKKISQCKCVSKVWRSIIEHPSFAQSYRRRQPLCLVSSVPARFKGKEGGARRFYYSTFGAQQQEPCPSVDLFNICLFDKEGTLDTFRVTQMVNGLFCCSNRNQLFLRNVFTGESMRLPLPDVPADIHPAFHFGFDPVNGVYKLLSLTHLNSKSLGRSNFQCDILTLGLGSNNTSWRRLPNFTSPVLFDVGSTFVNGAIYWRYGCMRISSKVQCFNLTDERFSSFEIRLPALSSSFGNYFVQFRGRFSMLSCARERLILYTKGDDGRSLEWTRHEAVLPGEFWHHCPIDLSGEFWRTVVPVGNLRTGELLLMNDISLKDPKFDNHVTPIYSYDDRNNRFERFVVGKLPPRSSFWSSKSLSVMEQNIETLDAILCRGK